MAALGLGHQRTGLFQQLGGGTLVEAQPCTVGGKVLPVEEARAAHGLHAGQLHRMPPVVGEEGQPQFRDEDVVDLILRVHGAGAGDDVVAAGQRFGADQLQQQAGNGPVVVAEHHELVGQCLGGALVEHFALRRDGRKQPQFFAAKGLGAGQHPGTQALDVAAHFFKVCTAGFGPAAVQQQTPGRSDIPRRPAAQHGVAGEQGPHIVGVGVQCLGVDGVVQAHHHLVRAGGIRLHHMGRSGVHDGLVPRGQDDAVQAVGVAGTVDALHGLALLFGGAGQPLHQGGFAAAGAAFDQVHLHPGFTAQRLKIALEPGGRGRAQEKIHGNRSCVFHSVTPLFCFRVCKREVFGSVFQSPW